MSGLEQNFLVIRPYVIQVITVLTYKAGNKIAAGLLVISLKMPRIF